jgi:hypothetical protein
MHIRWGGAMTMEKFWEIKTFEDYLQYFEVEELLLGKQSSYHLDPWKEKWWICCEATPYIWPLGSFPKHNPN